VKDNLNSRCRHLRCEYSLLKAQTQGNAINYEPVRGVQQPKSQTRVNTKSTLMSTPAPTSGQQSAAIQNQYCPRRQLPIPTSSPSRKPDKYTILFREPGKDRVPRYVLRDIQDPSLETPLLRVSLFDITDFVSEHQLEKFENGRFAASDFDFPSFKTWLRLSRREHMEIDPDFASNVRLLARSPNVQVVIRSERIPLSEVDGSLDVNGSLSPISAAESPRIAPTVDGDDGKYEVSHILEHKDVLGRRYHLVAWKDLPTEKSTWLTSDELEALGIDTTSESEKTDSSEPVSEMR
jgi:hypothetical protein